jgi:hypothetical protein
MGPLFTDEPWPMNPAVRCAPRVPRRRRVDRRLVLRHYSERRAKSCHKQLRRGPNVSFGRDVFVCAVIRTAVGVLANHRCSQHNWEFEHDPKKALAGVETRTLGPSRGRHQLLPQGEVLESHFVTSAEG